MTIRRNPPEPLEDIETPHPLAVESGGLESRALPLRVPLGDSWSDFLRVGGDRGEAGEAARLSPAVPLLDEMKGILQWD